MATRWPEAVPLNNRTAIPLVLLSDQGAQFTGGLMNQLCTALGIQPL